jgi:hypothetical protein
MGPDHGEVSTHSTGWLRKGINRQIKKNSYTFVRMHHAQGMWAYLINDTLFLANMCSSTLNTKRPSSRGTGQAGSRHVLPGISFLPLFPTWVIGKLSSCHFGWIPATHLRV